VILVTMLPILIMPDSAIEPEDECLPEPSESATESADLYDFPELWGLMPQSVRRGRPPLGPWVDIRPRVPPIAQDTDAAPASLQDCEQLLKSLLRRKVNALGPAERKELRRIMYSTTIAPASIATLSPETATWLLWAMNWRGVSTPRQLVSPPLHAPTLVVQWWMSMPTSLSFGPAATLLRVFADCAERLYRFWWRTVTRKRGPTADALDPRIVRIKFTPVILEKNSAETIENLPGKRPFATLVCGNLPRSDTIAA
jgi:hypothetical protein